LIRALILTIVAIVQPELIERTLALVGGQPITMGDVRAVTALGLLDANLSPGADAVSRLVDRELILREVERYAPAVPPDAAVDARLAEIRKRFPDAAAMTRVLETTGFSEVRLRSWVRDDLRGQAYLAQRFASASTPTEAEVSRAYGEQRPQFDKQGLTFEQAAPAIRERLINARRIELINDWLSDLRRRTDVVILPQ
jgi:hypothetical protein